ncbi:D-xylose transporter XylE [Echinimonas agarilytica]|uniref:D-xylose-proton symporter n=1 Tax=Echinimonas agarilytica TaxID=1215918 RepID=A0AA41W6T2_9GAMM|nr:D-xylose transporter XylE [Echinimonas agarilytica]MCM2680000.1 D-xylose transporter XylE [Echinimonas agarilytica]
MVQTGKTNLMAITFAVALGGLLFGYDTAVISGTTEALTNFFQGSPAEMGFAFSSALLGCIVGAIVAGFISNSMGRRGSLLLAAILFFISAIGSAVPDMFVPSFMLSGDVEQDLNAYYWSFIVFRLIGGVGVGIASMVSPMYIAEVAPAERRGALVACNQFAIIFGMLVVYFVNYGIAQLGDLSWLYQTGWRYMFASEMIPATLFFVLLLRVPETPRWLALQGRDEEAKGLLAGLGGAHSVQSQWNEIQQSMKQKTGKLLSPKVFYVLTIGIMLSVFQQITGINVFLYYAPEILKGFGDGNLDIALLQTIMVGAVNLIFTVIAIKTVDKFGRRPLMMIGSAAMAVCMIAIGTAAYLDAVGGYLLVFVLGYIAAFALSLGPVVWVLLSEIFPNNVRSKALSVAVFFQWFSNFLVSQTFPMMNAKDSFLYQSFNGGFPFWFYGAMAVLTVVFVYKWVPETKGLTLEELEDLWEQKTEEDPIAEVARNQA